MTTASAAGKIILLGEHAVVYGRPAIAAPVSDVRAAVEIKTLPIGEGIIIEACDLDRSFRLDESYETDDALPLQTTVRNTLQALAIPAETQNLRLIVRSAVPIARGMGSGTAVATAIVRALAQHLGQHLTARAVSDLVYQTELILHGTPSGIDNTVVAFEQPVYFVKGQQADIFWVGRPITFLIADTGIPSKTRDTVHDVRQRWLADRAEYEAIFDRIGAVVNDAKEALAAGDALMLGRCMDENHRLLCEIGVSCAELDRLVESAKSAGASGAKLSGGGRGGCMIALVDEASRDRVAAALMFAGAHNVMVTTLR